MSKRKAMDSKEKKKHKVIEFGMEEKFNAIIVFNVLSSNSMNVKCVRHCNTRPFELSIKRLF